MRDIKFRGKDLFSKWRYGDLVQEKWGQGKAMMIKKEKRAWNILEETVGQYTGIKDKNGKEIYEGDIVLIDAYTYTEPEFSEEYLVEYNELLGTWELKNLEDNKDIKTFEDLNGWYKLDIKLLGNKWNNPELLEEGE